MVRLNKAPEMINIDLHLEDICIYFANRKNVAAAFLLGSYGTQYQTILSDVDTAVLFVPNATVNFEIELSILADLTNITGEEDINLVVLNKATLPLQFEVLTSVNLTALNRPV